jgi:peroxin-1
LYDCTADVAEVIYEDVGRIEPEGRITTIKEKMASWTGQAEEKSPCLLILDGLDMLLPPENEASQLGVFRSSG